MLHYKITASDDPNLISVDDEFVSIPCGAHNATGFELFNGAGEFVARGVFDGDHNELIADWKRLYPELELKIR